MLAALGTDTPLPPPEGNAVQAPVFPEERQPPGDPAHPNAFRFGLHAYFRAPLRLAWRPRVSPKPGEASDNIHTPWLVDDDPERSGFVYTRNAEGDFTEVYLMAGNTWLTAVVGLAGSLYSDPAQPLIDHQMGIAQGFVVFRHKLDFGSGTKLRIRIKGGAFQDRFGWMEKYDTYLFGRTHQMGEQARVDLDVGKFTFSALEGFGAHLENLQANQGLSLIDSFRLSASYDRLAEISLYYLRTWTQDQRQLSQIDDGSMRVMGVEARVDTGAFGRLQAGISGLSADQAVWLAPSLEIVHAFGGTGLTQNYLGTDSSKNGTGSLFNVGWQYDFSAAALLSRIGVRPPGGWGDAPAPPGSPPPWTGRADATLSLFGVYTRVGSEQKSRDPTVNRDGDQMLKWGGEVAVWPLSWIGASFRYDRVIPDIHNDPTAFRIFSPRVTLRTHWIADALVFAQVSHYDYGAGVTLRQGQVPLETKPDSNVFKVQAQIVF
jgi:hypothetical protein